LEFDDNENLEKGDYYKALTKLCNEYGRRYMYKTWTLNGLRNLSVDTSIKWLRQYLNKPELTCKITTDDWPIRNTIQLNVSEDVKKEESFHRNSLKSPTYRMWDLVGKDFSLNRALSIMSARIACGYIFTEMSGAEDIENLRLMFFISIAIPENISKPDLPILDSKIQIVKFKIVYTLDRYFENEERFENGEGYQEDCDCEVLKLWNVQEVDITGEEVTALDFLRGETNFMTVSF